MFKKSCVAVAVGMALMQWAPAWAEAPSEDFIVVDQPISLNDVTKPQDSTVNYDKNVLYQTGLGLNGQGGTKNLVVNVKDGKGQFVIKDQRAPIKMTGSNVHLTFNSDLVMEGMIYKGIDWDSGSNKSIDIKGDFIYRNGYAPAVHISNGNSPSYKNLFITVDGKASFEGTDLGGSNNYAEQSSILYLGATNFEAKKGILINNIDVHNNNGGAMIYVQSGSVKAEGATIQVSNVNYHTPVYMASSFYVQESTVIAGQILVDNLTKLANGDLYGYMNGTAGNTISDKLSIQNLTNNGDGDSCALYLEADYRDRYDTTRFNAGDVVIKNIVSTQASSYGLYAQGARADNGKLLATPKSITIEGVHGVTAGIGALISNGASWTTTGDMTIVDVNASAGDSVGALIGSMTDVGGTLTVKNIKGVNSAVGVQLEDASKFSAQKFVISDIAATGGPTVGLFAINADAGDLRDVYVNVNTGNKEAYEGAFKTAAVTQKAQIDTYALQTAAQGKINWKGGIYNIFGNLQADQQQPPADPNAGLAPAGSIAISGDARIYGDVYAVDGGSVDLTLEGETAVLEGQTDAWSELKNQSTLAHTSELVGLDGNVMTPTSAGTINLALQQGAVWKALGQSSLTSLDNSGMVDMTTSSGSSVFAESLKGNGDFVMQIKGDGSGNMIYVANALGADAQHNVKLKLDAKTRAESSLDDLVDVRFATTGGSNDAYAGTEFKVSMLDQGFRNVTLKVGKEAYDKTATDKNAAYNGTGAGEGDYKPGNDYVDSVFGNEGTNWYIAGYEEVVPDPDPKPDPEPEVPEISDAGSTILAMARSNYWTAVEMDRLNKRLGDARYANGDDGVWLRLRYESNGTASGVGDFESDAVTYQLGFDHAFKRENGRWILGAAIDYKDAEVDYKAVTGEGNTDRFGVKVYGTWLGESGAYADVNAIWGRLSNDFSIVNGSGERVTGDYDNHIMGVSLESGHCFDAKSGLFIEPQVQVQYLRVTDGNYSTSQGTRMVQDSFDSVISRAGVRGGFTFGKTHENQIYAKADWLHEWSGEQKITAYDATTSRSGFDASIDNKGSWYDAGFGIQTKFTETSYGFFDVEHRFGNSLDHSWVLNAGLRYAF